MTVQDDHGRYNVRFPWLNVSDDYHPLAHQSKPGYAKKVIIDTWLFSTLAAFAKDLDSTLEPNGATALDNSLVVWSSDMNEGSFHFVGGLPFLLIGSCGGAIKTGGRVLRLGPYVGKDVNYTSASGVAHNQLLATLWNAMGSSPSRDSATQRTRDARFPAPRLRGDAPKELSLRRGRAVEMPNQ